MHSSPPYILHVYSIRYARIRKFKVNLSYKAIKATLIINRRSSVICRIDLQKKEKEKKQKNKKTFSAKK